MMHDNDEDLDVQIDEPIDPLHIPYQIKVEPPDFGENDASTACGFNEISVTNINANGLIEPMEADLEIKSENDYVESDVIMENTNDGKSAIDCQNLHSEIEIKDEPLEASIKNAEPCTKYETVGTIEIINNKRKFARIHQCMTCDYRTKLYTEIRAHVANKYIEIKPRYECYICNKVIVRRYTFMKHLSNHDQKDIKIKNNLKKLKKERKIINKKKIPRTKCTLPVAEVYECHICKKIVKKRAYLMRHLYLVHEILNYRDLTNDCYVCDEQFESSDPLLTHLKTVHNLSSLKPQCIDCEKKFKNRATFKSHIHRKHGINYKGYDCEICGKHFQYSGVCKLHKITEHNIGVKEVTCDICSSTFKCKTFLLLHMKKVHIIIENKKFKCDICNEFLRCKRNLIMHRIKLHNVGIENIMCEKCGVFLKSKEHLKNHLRTHGIGKKSTHTCNICGKQGFPLTHLRDHIEAVHRIGAKKTKCEICGRVYECRVYLNSHVKRSHQLNPKEYDLKFGIF